MKRAFETLRVTGTSIGLPSVGTFDGAQITVETASIRYRVDGSDATASLGHVAEPGDLILLENRNELRDFRAIRLTSSATLQITYTEGRN